MSFGPRLVIPGAIFGSLALAMFLFIVTAGATFPPPMLSDEIIPTPDIDTTVPSENEPIGLENQSQENDSEVESVGCKVSNKFPDSIMEWCDLISRYAVKRDLPPDLIAALIWQESGGNPVAYSKSGAVGLMQVMPRDGLASSFMCVNGPCFTNRPSIEELQNPEFNVKYGTKMLQELVSKSGNFRDALKSYGPMNVGYYYADKVLGIFDRYRNE